MPRYAPLYLLLLGSCRCGPPPRGETALRDTVDTGPVPCGIGIEYTWPVLDGLVDAPGAVEVGLSDPDPSFAFVTDVPGTTESDDRNEEWRFVPDSPFSPNTTYSIGLHTCTDDYTLTFATSELGEPLDAPLAGQTYALDLAGARVVEPVGLGSVLVSYTDPALVALAATDPDALTIITAVPITKSEVQDTCDVTGSALADFSTTPSFDTPVDALDVLFVGDMRTRVHQARLAGIVAPDASRIGNASLTGEFYAGRLADVFGFADGDELCDYVVSFGAACVPCAEDPDANCLPLEIERISAPLVEGTSLLPVAADDCPGCDTGAPVCPE